MNVESIIFDLDGTLWDSSENVASLWMETITTFGSPLLKSIHISGEDIRGVMGMPMDMIGKKFFPMLSETRQLDLINKCSEVENNYLATTGGKLVPRLEETLAVLSKTHRLFIVSNCQNGYIETFFEYCGHQRLFLERMFTDYLCWGDTGKSKGETIKILMNKNNCTSAVYVGDTQGDCDAAISAGISFVHAAYGFGKITSTESVSAAVKSFEELTQIF